MLHISFFFTFNCKKVWITVLWKLQHNSDDCSLFQLNISYVARYMRAMKYWDTLARKHVNLRAPHQSIAAHSFYCQLPRVGNNQTFRLSGKHPNPKSIFCGPRKYPCPPEKGEGVIRNSKVKGGVSKAKLLKEKIWTKTGISRVTGGWVKPKSLQVCTSGTWRMILLEVTRLRLF